MLGTDVSDLIETIGHNLDAEGGDRRFQRKVAYNNIPAEHIGMVRRIVADLAQRALEDMNSEMASHDRDGNPGVDGTGRKRAGISIFYFEEDLNDKTDQK